MTQRPRRSPRAQAIPCCSKPLPAVGGKVFALCETQETCFLICAPLVVKPGALLAIDGCILRKPFLLPVISKFSLLLTSMVTLCTWVNVSAVYNAATRS